MVADDSTKLDGFVGGDLSMSGTELVEGSRQSVLGPHRVPRIECGKCGHEHHIDCATTKFQGHCTECYAFLRRPTEAENRKFYDFMDWKARHAESEYRQ